MPFPVRSPHYYTVLIAIPWFTLIPIGPTLSQFRPVRPLILPSFVATFRVVEGYMWGFWDCVVMWRDMTRIRYEESQEVLYLPSKDSIKLSWLLSTLHSYLTSRIQLYSRTSFAKKVHHSEPGSISQTGPLRAFCNGLYNLTCYSSRGCLPRGFVSLK